MQAAPPLTLLSGGSDVVARKLIILANALIADNQTYQLEAPKRP